MASGLSERSNEFCHADGVRGRMAGMLVWRLAATCRRPIRPPPPSFLRSPRPTTWSGRPTYYLGRLKKSVDSETQYKEDQGKVSKDANTLILIGLALGWTMARTSTRRPRRA